MPYKDISAQEFKSLSEKDNFVILDVRAEKEYEEGLIPNHTLVNYFLSDFNEQLLKLDKSKNYLVYCRSGKRSARACVQMEELGFQGELYNLEGGIMEWNETFGKQTN